MKLVNIKNTAYDLIEELAEENGEEVTDLINKALTSYCFFIRTIEDRVDELEKEEIEEGVSLKEFAEGLQAKFTIPEDEEDDVLVEMQNIINELEDNSFELEYDPIWDELDED